MSISPSKICEGDFCKNLIMSEMQGISEHIERSSMKAFK